MNRGLISMVLAIIVAVIFVGCVVTLIPTSPLLIAAGIVALAVAVAVKP